MTTKRLVLNFPANTTGKPLASQLIRGYDVELNILSARVDEGMEGTLFVEIWGSQENIEAGMEFLRDSGIDVRDVISIIEVDADKCVACGACTAACVVGALTMTGDELFYDDDKCLECRLCIRACPVKAISSLV